jgi:hypothetical protein
MSAADQSVAPTAPIGYQQVQDAIERVELHNFRGTAVVVCALICRDGNVVLGVGLPAPGEAFNIAEIAARARKNAEDEVAKNLQAQQDLQVQQAQQDKQRVEPIADESAEPRG